MNKRNGVPWYIVIYYIDYMHVHVDKVFLIKNSSFLYCWVPYTNVAYKELVRCTFISNPGYKDHVLWSHWVFYTQTLP